ncbi:MAG: hypothetical protein GY718_09515 [Lentisphaerae bacterium]|nr:hypothetical protein [Lentisphaerota bacterium]
MTIGKNAFGKKNVTLEEKAKAASEAVSKFDALPKVNEKKVSISATVSLDNRKNFEISIAEKNISLMDSGVKLNKSNVIEALMHIFAEESKKDSSPVVKEVVGILAK